MTTKPICTNFKDISHTDCIHFYMKKLEGRGARAGACKKDIAMRQKTPLVIPAEGECPHFSTVKEKTEPKAKNRSRKVKDADGAPKSAVEITEESE